MPRPRSAGLTRLRAAAWPVLTFLATAAALWWWLPARPAVTLPGDEAVLGFSTRGRRAALVSIRKVRGKDGALYHEGPVRVRDLADGRTAVEFAGGERSLHRVVLSPTGTVLATQEWSESMVWKGSTVRLWDVGTGRRLAEFGAFSLKDDPTIVASCFSPDGSLFAYVAPPVIEKDGQASVKAIAVWDVAGRRRRALIGDIDWFAPFAFSPDGRTLAVSAHREGPPARKGESPDAFPVVRLWDVEKAREVAVFRASSASHYSLGVRSLAFSPDGRTLAAGTSALLPAGSSRDLPARLRLWDLTTGAERVTIDTRQYGDVTAAQFSADGRFLVARLGGGMLLPTQYAVYDLTAGPPWQVGGLSGMNAFHPGRGLVASSNDPDLGAFGALFGAVLGTPEVRASVTLRDPARGGEFELCGFDGRAGRLSPLAFAPDGRTLAVSETRRPENLPWTSPGRWNVPARLLLGGQRVRLYDVPTRRALAWSPGADGAQFSPDSAAVVTSGSDTPVVSHTPDGDRFYAYARGAPVRVYPLPAGPDAAFVFGASAVAALVAFGFARAWGSTTPAGFAALVASGFARAWRFFRRYALVILIAVSLAAVPFVVRARRYLGRAARYQQKAEFYRDLASALGVWLGNGVPDGIHRLPDSSTVRIGAGSVRRIYYPPDAANPADDSTKRRLNEMCMQESWRQGWRQEQCERAAFRPWVTVEPDPPPPPGRP